MENDRRCRNGWCTCVGTVPTASASRERQGGEQGKALFDKGASAWICNHCFLSLQRCYTDGALPFFSRLGYWGGPGLFPGACLRRSGAYGRLSVLYYTVKRQAAKLSLEAIDVNYPVIPGRHRWYHCDSGVAEVFTLCQIPVWTGQFLGSVIKYVKTTDSGWAQPATRLVGTV